MFPHGLTGQRDENALGHRTQMEFDVELRAKNHEILEEKSLPTESGHMRLILAWTNSKTSGLASCSDTRGVLSFWENGLSVCVRPHVSAPVLGWAVERRISRAEARRTPDPDATTTRTWEWRAPPTDQSSSSRRRRLGDAVVRCHSRLGEQRELTARAAKARRRRTCGATAHGLSDGIICVRAVDHNSCEPAYPGNPDASTDYFVAHFHIDGLNFGFQRANGMCTSGRARQCHVTSPSVGSRVACLLSFCVEVDKVASTSLKIAILLGLSCIRTSHECVQKETRKELRQFVINLTLVGGSNGTSRMYTRLHPSVHVETLRAHCPAVYSQARIVRGRNNHIHAQGKSWAYARDLAGQITSDIARSRTTSSDARRTRQIPTKDVPNRQAHSHRSPRWSYTVEGGARTPVLEGVRDAAHPAHAGASLPEAVAGAPRGGTSAYSLPTHDGEFDH
ncbi:hypothetical protein BKA93DRAFT_754229 [Sparassis latifolia]